MTKLIESTVATGNTVVWDDEESAGVHAGPGEIVRLSEEETARLRALGALVDPDRPAIRRIVGDGTAWW